VSGIVAFVLIGLNVILSGFTYCGAKAIGYPFAFIEFASKAVVAGFFIELLVYSTSLNKEMFKYLADNNCADGALGIAIGSISSDFDKERGMIIASSALALISFVSSLIFMKCLCAPGPKNDYDFL
jgi:hypothetical protein